MRGKERALGPVIEQNSCLVPKLRNFTAKITLCVARAGVLLLEYCCCLKTCAARTLSVKSCCATRPCASSQISCRTNRCKSSASMTQGRAGRLTSQTTCRCSQRPSAQRSSKSDFPEASCCLIALQKGSICLLWRPKAGPKTLGTVAGTAKTTQACKN